MRPDGGIVAVERMDCRLAPYDWAFARNEAARIDAHWAAQRRLKPSLFDGRVLLAHAVEAKDDTLHALYFETTYRNFLSWRDFGFPGAPVANCFAMAALRSADGAFMLGEMSGGTANGGKIYFPAGTPEPSDLVDGDRIMHEASILRELEEETGLAPHEVTLDAGWTLVFAGPAIACMRVVQSGATSAALQERLVAHNSAQADPELTRLVPVRGPDDFDRERMPDFMIRYLSATLAKGRDQAR